MARRGSEKRLKTVPVMVRVTESQYARLKLLAALEVASPAEYLRRRIGEPAGAVASGAASSTISEGDRILLASATRTMGHLAGLLKHAAFKYPAVGRSAEFRSILDTHHRDLQALQSRIRALIERLE
jgi:hypothetical protein